MNQELEQIWSIARPYVEDAGFELCEVDWGREASGWVLRLYIDRPAGSLGAGDDLGAPAPGVSLSDCERVSRDVSAALDVDDFIHHAYKLEVSSPGLDRPLRREQDFARFVGRRARIRLVQGLDGRRNYAGTIRGAGAGRIELECDGQVHGLPVSDLARANLVPDWDEEFRKAGARSSAPGAARGGPAGNSAFTKKERSAS